MGMSALTSAASESDCSLVNSLSNNSAGRCALVRSLDDCDAGRAQLPYVDFLYCGEQTAGSAALVLLFLWLVTLFVALGSTASSYLCPALVHISKSLQLSQGVAGVTFLAFGNGAPDTIATIASIRRDRTALAIGELFGGGTYVATIVVGLIFISSNFQLIQSSLLRDIIFYLAASFWAFTLYMKGCIKLADSVGFIVLYLVYITVAVWGEKFLSKISKLCRKRRVSRRVSVCSQSIRVDKSTSVSSSSSSSSSSKCEEESPDLASLAEADDVVNTPPPFLSRPRLRRSSSGISLHHHHENAIYYFTVSVEELRAEPPSPEVRRPSGASQASFSFVRTSSSVFPGEATPLLSQSLGEGKVPPAYGEWTEFLLHISPVEPDEWKGKHLCAKIYEVLTLPISLVLVLTIPVVDHENRRANWSRPLNALHCVTGPIVALGVFGVLTVRAGNLVPTWCLVIVVGLTLALLVWFTSSAQEPPRYHLVFAYAGFAMSIIWIYGIATEIVALLKAFGTLYGVSDVLLGMTVLAWGNNIGDLVTNLSLARQGFPQMAMAACFAGPVLALLLGIGIAFSMNLASRTVSCVELHYSELLPLIYGALVIVLFVLLLSALVTWFRSSRAVGVLLILLYVSFLLTTGLVEFWLIRKG
uniref:Putative k+-dependent na+:ca2+ antiporter n=1 Tax=Amblyomma triste TaxID=251400 RepID=A0A023GLR3_AMBTT